MSRIDSSMRNAVPPTGRVRQQQLNAPGLAAQGVVLSNSARIAERLDQAMAMTGQIFGQLGRAAEQKRAASAEEEALIRGKAVQDAREQLPAILQDIADRKIAIPTDADPAEFARQLAQERAGGYQSDAAKEAFSNAVTPSLAGALVRQRADDRTAAIGEAAALMTENAILASDPKSIREQVDAYRAATNATETEALGTVALKAVQSAAENGDIIRLEAAMDVLGDRFPAEQRRAKQIFATKVEQQQRELREAAKARVSTLIDGNTPAELIEQTIAANVGDLADMTGRTEDQLRWEMVSDRLAVASMRGDWDQFESFSKSAGASEPAKLESLRLQAMGVYRSKQTDAVIARVRLDPEFSGDQAVQILNARLDAYAANPDDPNGIGVDQYDAAIRRVVEERTAVTKFQLDYAAAGDAIAKTAAGQRADPLPPGMDNAVAAQAINIGAISGAVTAGGSVTITGVPDPQTAAILMNVNGAVIGDWSGLIRRGFSTGDQAQVAKAGTDLLALFRQNPALAHQVIGEMNGDAQIRAQTFLDYATEQVGPFGSDGFDRSVQKVALDVANIDPTKLDPKRIDQLLKGGAKVVAVNDKLEDALSEWAGSEPTFGFWFGQATFLGESDRDMGPIGIEVSSFYEQQLQRAIRQRLIRGEDDETAMESAHKIAGARTLAKFPPMAWDGTVYLAKGKPVPPQFQDYVRERLGDEYRAGRLTEPVSFYMANYRPMWNEQEQGWTLHRVGRMDETLEGFIVGYAANEREAKLKAIEEAKKNARNTENAKTFLDQFQFSGGP